MIGAVRGEAQVPVTATSVLENRSLGSLNLHHCSPSKASSMGADQKRREARRLKFGSQQRGGQSTDASNIDEAHVGENLVGDRPTKRQKTQHGGKDRPQVSSNVPSKPEKDASEGTGETTLIAKGRGGNRGPVEEETTKSGQRFIVFIGALIYRAFHFPSSNI